MLHVDGVKFEGNNARLEHRLHRIRCLINDLNAAFRDAAFQRQLDEAEDRVTVQRMIMAVQNLVMPRHGFPMSEDVSRTLELAVRMRAFNNTGMLYPDIKEAANRCAHLSGITKMGSLQ